MAWFYRDGVGSAAASHWEADCPGPCGQQWLRDHPIVGRAVLADSYGLGKGIRGNGEGRG